MLGAQLSNRESRTSWSTFVTGLKAGDLHWVEFVVSDDHAPLKRRRYVPKPTGVTISETSPSSNLTITKEC